MVMSGDENENEKGARESLAGPHRTKGSGRHPTSRLSIGQY